MPENAHHSEKSLDLKMIENVLGVKPDLLSNPSDYKNYPAHYAAPETYHRSASPFG